MSHAPETAITKQGSPLSTRLAAVMTWVGLVATVLLSSVYAVMIHTGDSDDRQSSEGPLLTGMPFLIGLTLIIQITGTMLGLVQIYRGSDSVAVRTGVWAAPLICIAMLIGVFIVMIFNMQIPELRRMA